MNRWQRDALCREYGLEDWRTTPPEYQDETVLRVGLGKMRRFLDALPQPVREPSHSAEWAWLGSGACVCRLIPTGRGGWRMPRHPGRGACPCNSDHWSDLLDHHLPLLADGMRIYVGQPYWGPINTSFFDGAPDTQRRIDDTLANYDGELAALYLGHDASWWNPPGSSLWLVTATVHVERIADALVGAGYTLYESVPATMPPREEVLEFKGTPARAAQE